MFGKVHFHAFALPNNFCHNLTCELRSMYFALKVHKVTENVIFATFFDIFVMNLEEKMYSTT
jgi:hypothetical protein